MKTKGPGARDGEHSFGRHPSNSFTTPDTKRTKGQGPGMVNVLLAATHSNSFTTCGLKGQGQGMVNVLLACHPQRLVHDLGRLRARSQDWWTFFCSHPEQTRSRRGRRAEVSQYPSFSTCVTDITYVTDVNLSRDLQLGRFW